MKKLSILFLLFAVVFANAQMSRDEILKKYLRNGAYRYSYYRPEYQKYIDSALVLLPKDAFLWQQKAMPYFKRKKYEVGMPYLDKAVLYDQDKDLKYLAYRAFIKCIFQKNYAGAIADFDLLLKHYDRGIIMDHSYYFYKGLSLLQLDRLAEAKENLQKSMDLNKVWKFDPHPLELFYMGIVCMEQEDFDGSLRYLDESLKQYPTFSDALFYRGEVYYFTKKEGPALENFKKAMENLNKGNTISEDNALYEEYPYQLKKWMIQNYYDILEYKE